MLSFSSDPTLADKQMRAIIFYLTTFGHIDGEFDASERNFVKKGISWAMRRIGTRSPTLHAAALETAQRLAASSDASARWIGKDALRDLTRPQKGKP